MSEVYKIGITNNNNQKITEVNSIKVVANQGIIGDRHFSEFNEPYNQLSLIESENIDYYLEFLKLNIYNSYSIANHTLRFQILTFLEIYL